jgi:acetyl-CoA acyltransferase
LGWRLVNERMPAEWTVSLGEGNEQLREKYGISRERQDAFAARSHQLADAAWAGSFYDDRRCSDMPPVEAAEQALRRTGIGWAEVGAVELNEAFAVQSLVCIDAWGIDPEIVNVHGGAIAIGHPLSASGGRILGTLTKVLQERRERWGVAAICIGVGQALAVVLENTSGGELP